MLRNTIAHPEKQISTYSESSLYFVLQEKLQDYYGISMTLHSEIGEHQTITGAEIWNKGLLYAAGLETIGIREGDRIACCLENGDDFVALFLACLHIKATFCPLAESDCNHDASFLLKRMNAVDPRIIICSQFTKFNSPYRLDITSLNKTENFLLRKPTRLSSKEMNVILWTSSSEYAKAIGFNEVNIIHQINVLSERIGIKKTEKVCAYISWPHSFGFIVEMLIGLVSQANLVTYYPKNFNAEILLKFIAQYPKSYLFGWRSTFGSLLSNSQGREWLKTSKGGIIVGGAVLPLHGCELLTVLNSNFMRGYYITEATSLVCIAEKGNYLSDLIGKPVGCYMKISSRGTLLIRGACVSKTVWSGQSATMDRGWLDTEDLVEQHPNGNYIFQGSLNRTWKWSNGETYNPYPFEKDLRARSQAEVVVFKSNKDKHCIVVISPEKSVLDVFTDSERKYMIWIHSDEVKEYRTGFKWFYRKLAKHVMEHYITEPLEEELSLEHIPRLQIGYKYRLPIEHLFNYIEEPKSHLTLSADTEWALRRADNFAKNRDHLYSDFIKEWDYHPLRLYRAFISPPINEQDKFLPHDVVLGTMIARLRSFAQGKSGATQNCFDWLTEACKMRLTPYIPLEKHDNISSYMSYALTAWCGKGHFVTEDGEIISSREHLKKNHIQPIPITGRDVMVLLNDSILTLGITSAAFSEYVKIFSSLISISGLFYDCFKADLESISHYNASNPNNTKIVNLLRKAISTYYPSPSDQEETNATIFIDTLPEILGANLDHLSFHQKTLENSLNGVTDNVVFDAVAGQVLKKKTTIHHHLYLASRHLNDMCSQTQNTLDELNDSINTFDVSLKKQKYTNTSCLGLGLDPIDISWETYENCKSLQVPIAQLLINLKNYMDHNNHPLFLNPKNECFIFMNQMQDKNYSSEELKKLFDSFVDLNTPFIIRKEILKTI